MMPRSALILSCRSKRRSPSLASVTASVSLPFLPSTPPEISSIKNFFKLQVGVERQYRDTSHRGATESALFAQFTVADGAHILDRIGGALETMDALQLEPLSVAGDGQLSLVEVVYLKVGSQIGGRC